MLESPPQVPSLWPSLRRLPAHYLLMSALHVCKCHPQRDDRLPDCRIIHHWLQLNMKRVPWMRRPLSADHPSVAARPQGSPDGDCALSNTHIMRVDVIHYTLGSGGTGVSFPYGLVFVLLWSSSGGDSLVWRQLPVFFSFFFTFLLYLFPIKRKKREKFGLNQNTSR